MQAIRFSHNFVAVPNIGGILSELLSAKSDPRALRVSERLEHAYNNSPSAQWVVVDLPDGRAAVTVVEARELGLAEAAWQ